MTPLRQVTLPLSVIFVRFGGLSESRCDLSDKAAVQFFLSHLDHREAVLSEKSLHPSDLKSKKADGL